MQRHFKDWFHWKDYAVLFYFFAKPNIDRYANTGLSHTSLLGIFNFSSIVVKSLRKTAENETWYELYSEQRNSADS